MKIKAEKLGDNKLADSINPSLLSQISEYKFNILAFSLSAFIVPISFYGSYVYVGDFLKESFQMSHKKVIHHNFKVSLLVILSSITFTLLVKKYHPAKVLKVNIIFVAILTLFTPYI